MKHVLLSMAKRLPAAIGDVTGAVQVGGRTFWTFNCRVPLVTSLVAFEVVLEMSPTGEAGTWTTVATTGTVTGTGDVFLSTKLASDFAITALDSFMWARARIVQLDATDVTFDLIVASPFLDDENAADSSLLSKELRNFVDGRDRIVATAEIDVLSKIRRHVVGAPVSAGSPTLGGVDRLAAEEYANAPEEPTITADLNAAGFIEAMKQEVALQADYLYTLYMLARGTEDEKKAALKSDRHVAGMGLRLKPFSEKNVGIFRGR